MGGLVQTVKAVKDRWFKSQKNDSAQLSGLNLPLIVDLTRLTGCQSTCGELGCRSPYDEPVIGPSVTSSAVSPPVAILAVGPPVASSAVCTF